MATILDVAREAGVGVGTVSRVINDHARVAPATRSRVLAVIERLEYSPNPIARSLSTGRTTAICVMVPFLTSSSVNARLKGVVEALRSSGREVMLRVVDSVEQRDLAIESILDGAKPAGLLVISLPLSSRTVQRLREAEIATVGVDVLIAGSPSITVDDELGGHLATSYLIDHGHRRIAFVGDTEDDAMGFTASVKRRNGYQAALAEHGIEASPSYIKAGSFGRLVAHRLTEELLTLEQPPTAIFAGSDTQAFGVLEAVRSADLRVPEDVSVIGYDDVEVAPYLGLTSVRQPLFTSGEAGAAALLALLSGSAVESVELELSIVERTTVGRR